MNNVTKFSTFQRVLTEVNEKFCHLVGPPFREEQQYLVKELETMGIECLCCVWNVLVGIIRCRSRNGDVVTLRFYDRLDVLL